MCFLKNSQLLQCLCLILGLTQNGGISGFQKHFVGFLLRIERGGEGSVFVFTRCRKQSLADPEQIWWLKIKGSEAPFV